MATSSGSERVRSNENEPYSAKEQVVNLKKGATDSTIDCPTLDFLHRRKRSRSMSPDEVNALKSQLLALKKQNEDDKRQIAVLTKEMREMHSRFARNQQPLAKADGFTKVVRGGRPEKTSGTQLPVVAAPSRLSVFPVEDITDPTPAVAAATKKRRAPIRVKMSAKDVTLLMGKTVQKEDWKVSSIGTGQAQIIPYTMEARSRLAEVLKAKEVQHVVFTDKEERPSKFVLRGMGDFTAEQIQEQLMDCEQLAIKPLSTVQMTGANHEGGARKRLPLFTVAFPPKTQLKDVQTVRALGNIICRFEAHSMRKTNNQPVRCYRCGEQGHFARQCFNKQVCIKCAGEHKSSECPIITRDSPREDLYCHRCKKTGQLLWLPGPEGGTQTAP